MYRFFGYLPSLDSVLVNKITDIIGNCSSFKLSNRLFISACIDEEKLEQLQDTTTSSFIYRVRELSNKYYVYNKSEELYKCMRCVLKESAYKGYHQRRIVPFAEAVCTFLEVNSLTNGTKELISSFLHDFLRVGTFTVLVKYGDISKHKSNIDSIIDKFALSKVRRLLLKDIGSTRVCKFSSDVNIENLIDGNTEDISIAVMSDLDGRIKVTSSMLDDSYYVSDDIFSGKLSNKDMRVFLGLDDKKISLVQTWLQFS